MTDSLTDSSEDGIRRRGRVKKQRGWQTGERVPSVLWRLRLAAGWSVALLDPNLSQISLRRRFHCSSSSSETFCCNVLQQVLGSFGIVAQRLSLLHIVAQHLSEKICLQGMSFCLAFQYSSTQFRRYALVAMCLCGHWTVYSIASTESIFRQITD